MNIVAVGAHQDDVELHCLGTLLRCVARGDSIVTVTTSNGERGASNAPQTPLAEVTATRVREAAAVADALGGHYECLDQPDQFVEDTLEARLALADVLRRARADLVLAPPPTDYHRDHIVTSELTAQATTMAAVRAVRTKVPALDRVPALYYMDAVAGLDWQPTHYVDVSEVFAEKCALLKLHASQMTNLGNWAGVDLIEYAEIVDRFRGLQSGVRYAEGYKPAAAWLQTRTGSPFP